MCERERREETTSDCGIKQLPDLQRLEEDCVILRITISALQLFILTDQNVNTAKRQHRSSTCQLRGTISPGEDTGKRTDRFVLFHLNSSLFSTLGFNCVICSSLLSSSSKMILANLFHMILPGGNLVCYFLWLMNTAI